MITKEFTIPCKPEVIKAADEDGSGGGIIITGIANTGLEDLVGDVVTQEALQSIAEQIPTHNLHLDHDKDFGGILGPLLDGWVDENGYLRYKARLVDEKSEVIESYLRQGVNLGSSISGCCEYEENSLSDIVTWQLTEISLTGIPCDQGTMGSVQLAKSFSDAVATIIEAKKKSINNGGTTMESEKTSKESAGQETTLTEERVIELINTAFNEKEEDLEARFNELVEKINDLESRVESKEEEGEEGEGTASPEGGEGAGEGESGKAEDEEEEEEEPEDEDDEEDDKSTESVDEKEVSDIIQKTVQEAVETKLKQVFSQNNPQFIYDNSEKGIRDEDKDAEEESTNKKYTPEEIADILAGN